MNRYPARRTVPHVAGAHVLLALLFLTMGRNDVTHADEPTQEDRPPQRRMPSAEELQGLPPGGGPEFNRLVFEKSPYLLQHARNPVHWYPWGDAAFERARREEKPVFLSIGYSTCHWCHVMEHESFEDDEVAAALNRDFVAIKVDREERPDVDNVYMNICMALTGSGGWPLTIVMTPDGKPFFAGTYFPKHSRLGRPGLVEVLQRIAEAWSERRDQVVESAAGIASAVADQTGVRPGDPPGTEALEEAFRQLEGRFDETYGGFGSAPKFPTPHNFLFLLRWWHRTGEDRPLAMVLRTLRAMRLGGMYDHVGFGFHRYSTDREWFLPHFEKMLYDQALLLMAYTEAYEATRDPFFATVAHEIVAYVLRDLTSPEGGFYSAEDADSEGEEGLFYLWTTEEFQRVLGDEDGAYYARLFGFEAEGNFVEEATGRRTGRNIPHLDRTPEETAHAEGEDADALRRRWEKARGKLLAERSRRVRPLRDDKILAAWNGLTIAALAKAARALDRPEYAEAGERAASFVLDALVTDDGRLLRRYREGAVAIPAYLDDYAFMVWGLLELYETTFDVAYLDRAVELNRSMMELFADTTDGGLFFTAADGERLVHRRKEIYDGALPSGNSVAACNLVRLGRITGDTGIAAAAEAQLRVFAGTVAAMPSAYTQYLVATDLALGPSREIVIVGDAGAQPTREMVAAVRARYLPRSVVLLRAADPDKAAPLIRFAPFVEAQTPRDGAAATAYVCENYACREPVTDAEALGKVLDAAR